MLDERKIRVLCAIIDSYIRVAEPIGSRTLSKEYDLGVSSATIRNEMSDLENLGYLNKPYTSSGRVPSDKAYRFYVNKIINAEEIRMDIEKKEEIKKILTRESREIDQLIQNSAKILSAITSYTALAISPQIKKIRLKHIQLVPLYDKEILVILVGDSGIVNNTMLRMDKSISSDQLNQISNFLNKKLKEFTIDGLEDLIKDDIFKDMYKFKETIDSVIPIISKLLEDINDIEVYADGVTKIFDFPEYRDTDKAKSFISFIEDKEQLINVLLNDPLNNGIEITIGDENIYDTIKDCSLITTTYKLGDMTIGKIGVIGPTRMDYLMVMNSLKLFSSNLTEIFDMLLSQW
ncbi:heat-inducible transcriptional repressor HrcA [Schnuerera sp. xch1]|uniref:heat-inducible transcriptional repressor HrcA n=1 Tax=Schnuerera sp. xch1 TaxID=2874283 RepID=UPI001CBB1863|nr:heat-inducible transcriptional repressor HrcA [Schnuerera sp. xch1]MBZ2175744.1 heat-inducible transcriptional repressor HrcA [Schnuerera sp. xch1]